MLFADEIVWESSLLCLLYDCGCHVLTTFNQIKLHNRKTNTLLRKELLGLPAERAIGLGEHHDRVLINQILGFLSSDVGDCRHSTFDLHFGGGFVRNNLIVVF